MKDLRTPYLKFLQFIVLLAVVLFNFSPVSTSPVYAIAPANDAWQDATVIGSIPFSDAVDTNDAQQELDEPVLGPAPEDLCNNQPLRAGKATVWYKYTAPATPASALVSMDTLGSYQTDTPEGSTIPYEFDTYIAVYTGTPSGNPNLVACNDDNEAGYRSQVGFTAVANTVYYIQVAQYNGKLNEDFVEQPYEGGFLKFHVGYSSQTEVYIGGGEPRGTYTVFSGTSTRDSYFDVNNGPVRVLSTNSVPIIAAERVIYKINGVNTSFSEMMALPDSQLSTTYWLPFYNNVDLDTQLRFGNVSGAAATVRVYIGGIEQAGCTSTPSKPYPYVLAISESVRVSCVGVSNGPVRVVSDQNIVVAERVIYTVNGLPTSFSEMMALPDSQLSATYWLPFYNNVDLDTQLRIGNVSGAAATVRVYIGGIEQAGCTSTPSKPYPYVLAIGESVRVSCVGLSNGPVRVVGNQNIVVAERVIYTVNGVPTSFSEMMGLPNSQLSTTYWLPFYNNVDINTQLRFGNVSGAAATVQVYIGGVEQTGCTSTPSKTYPYILAIGESVRVSCVGVSSGPVRVVGTQNIVVAERVIYTVNGVPTSFSEMMGLPNSLLNTSYRLPWYNNVDLDTQLRFGAP